MIYRAVGNRCAVNLKDLKLPISDLAAIQVLRHLGFEVLEVDLLSTAYKIITSKPLFKKVALIKEAPEVMSCSTFIKWVYAQKGIWLPTRAIQQYLFGKTVRHEETKAGDLLFVSGWNSDYYDEDPLERVGHVGMIKDQDTILSCSNRYGGVAEISFDYFIQKKDQKREVRGVKRYTSNNEITYTVISPENLEVEGSDDLRWMILKNL